MSDAEQPPWERLPHDPQRFFELEDGFDRKDLKRAYNRLLKRFKPERFPEEFQRIRAAFESLDDGLRYGIDLPSHAREARHPIDWGSLDASEPAAPGTPSITELIARLGPEAAFTERARDPRTADDFVELAILSDVVPGPRGFSQWLIEGLREVGCEAQLLRLLQGWAHEPQPTDQLIEAIRGVARLREPSTLGFVTERMWQQLSHSQPFGDVATLLEETRRTVGAAHDPSWATLLLRIVRATVFVADREWLDAQVREIEELALGHRMDVDAEFDEIELLLNYRQAVAEQGALATPLRRRVDETIRAIVAEDEAKADRRLLEVLLELRDAGDQVLEEFAPEDAPGLAIAGTLERWSFSGRERLGLAMPDERFAPKILRAQLRQLDRAALLSNLRSAWGLWDLFRVLLPVGLSIGILRWASTPGDSRGEGYLRWLAAILGLVGIAVFWHSTRRLIDLDPWFGRRMHRRYWRRSWGRFLALHPMPVGYIVSATPRVAPDDGNRWREIVETLAKDPGLYLYSLARRVG